MAGTILETSGMAKEPNSGESALELQLIQISAGYVRGKMM